MSENPSKVTPDNVAAALSKEELQARHELQAKESRIEARIDTLVYVQDRGDPAADAARRLFRDAKTELGNADHRLALRAERYLILSRARVDGAPKTADRLEGLLARFLQHHTNSKGTVVTRGYLARYRRYSGNPTWRDEYQSLLEDAEGKHGKGSRQASKWRLNLAVALLDWGSTDEERAESYGLAAKEFKWRLTEFGDKDPFVYRALWVMVRVGLRALQYERPVMDANELLRKAELLYSRCLHLLGADHSLTHAAFIDLHSVRAELGHADAPWQLLSVVGAEDAADRLGPEGLAVALCRAFALDGDVACAASWLKEAKNVLLKMYGPEAPRTTAAVEFLERSLRRIENPGL